MYEPALSQSAATLPHRPEFRHRVAWRRAATRPSSLGILETADPRSGWDIQTQHLAISEHVVRGSEQWPSAGIAWATELYLPRIQPKITISASAQPMLTDRVRATVERLLALLEREARRSFMPVSKIEVSGFIDPEEDAQEVVVTQWVKVSTRSALEYWDRLGAAIEAWIDFLPESLARVAVERLAVEVRSER